MKYTQETNTRERSSSRTEKQISLSKSRSFFSKKLDDLVESIENENDQKYQRKWNYQDIQVGLDKNRIHQDIQKPATEEGKLAIPEAWTIIKPEITFEVKQSNPDPSRIGLNRQRRSARPLKRLKALYIERD